MWTATDPVHLKAQDDYDFIFNHFTGRMSSILLSLADETIMNPEINTDVHIVADCNN